MSAKPPRVGGLPRADALVERLAAGLRTEDSVVLEGAWPAVRARALLAEAEALAAADALAPAAIGRGAGARIDPALRGDRRLWLDALDPAGSPALAAALADLDALRRPLDRALRLGVDELEAQLACYPPGRGYARHLDRFADHDARVLSLVLYLDPDWTAADGGALRLHRADGGSRDVPPVGGTLVAFLSDRVEHEVLPPTRPRWAIAAWLRRRAP